MVSPTILYASGTWTLTKDHERAFQRTQRIMLRMILGAGRRRQTPEPDTLSQEHDVDSDVDLAVNEQESEDSDNEGLEPWVDWIRRVTHHIEQQACKLDIKSWVVQAREHKWDLAKRVSDHEPSRWTSRVLNWDPQLFFDGQICRANRPQAHPKLRWTDDIARFMATCHGSSNWQQVAKNSSKWEACRKEFCDGTWRTTRQADSRS